MGDDDPKFTATFHIEDGIDNEQAAMRIRETLTPPVSGLKEAFDGEEVWFVWDVETEGDTLMIRVEGNKIEESEEREYVVEKGVVSPHIREV